MFLPSLAAALRIVVSAGTVTDSPSIVRVTSGIGVHLTAITREVHEENIPRNCQCHVRHREFISARNARKFTKEIYLAIVSVTSGIGVHLENARSARRKYISPRHEGAKYRARFLPPVEMTDI